MSFYTARVKRRRTQCEQMWSGLPPKADSNLSIGDVAEGPEAVIPCGYVAVAAATCSCVSQEQAGGPCILQSSWTGRAIAVVRSESHEPGSPEGSLGG